MNDRPNDRLEEGDDYALDIINVIRHSEGGTCTLAHDYVYGLLGMTTTNVLPQDEECDNAMTVSYHQSVGETFAELAAYIIKRDRCLSILYLDGAAFEWAGLRKQTDLDLSSWTPDWTSRLGSIKWIHRSLPDHRIGICYDLPIRKRWDTLPVRGFRIGVVPRETVTASGISLPITRATHLALVGGKLCLHLHLS